MQTPSTLRPPLLTPQFAWLTAGHFLQALGYSTFMLFPLYLHTLGATSGQIGLIMAAGSLAGLLSRPAVGAALDTLGRRPTLLAGAALASTGMFAVGFVDAVGPWAYASRIIFGLGVSALFTGYFTFASDVIPAARRTEGLALFGVSGLLPVLVNPLSETIGVRAAGVRWFIPVVGVLVALSAVAVLQMRETARRADREPLRLAAVKNAVLARPLWPVWLATAVFSTLVTLFAAFVVVAADRRGIASPTSIWITYPLAAASVRLFGARVPDLLGPANLVAPALACFGGAFLILASGPNPDTYWIAGLLGGLGHGYGFPVLSAQVVTRIPERVRGSGLAVYTAVWGACEIVLTPIFGAFADAFGDSAMFSLAALLAAAGIAGWVVLEHKCGASGDAPW